jgi:hypothetical protein
VSAAHCRKDTGKFHHEAEVSVSWSNSSNPDPRATSAINEARSGAAKENS